MELQWPLILFTTFVAWAAGLFGVQGVLALLKGADGKRGTARKAQLPALIGSVVLLAISGVSVFFHLQHWERIFNGFGHLTSGITQELIAIVVFVLVAFVYFLMLRRAEEPGTVPAWVAVLAIAISAVLALVCAHSYMMASRPAWDSVLQVLSVLGAALVAGPATLAAIMAFAGDDVRPVGPVALAGAIAGAVLVVAYAAYLQTTGGSFIDVGYYSNPTTQAEGQVDFSAVGWKKADARLWKALGTAAAVCAVVGAICLRVGFYQLGYSVFMYF